MGHVRFKRLVRGQMISCVLKNVLFNIFGELYFSAEKHYEL